MLLSRERLSPMLVGLVFSMVCSLATADNGGKLGPKNLKGKKGCGMQSAPQSWEPMTPLTNPDFLYAFWTDEAWLAECYNRVNYECGDALTDAETRELVAAVHQEVADFLFYHEDFLGEKVSEAEILETTLLAAARNVHTLLVAKDRDAFFSYVCRHYAFALQAVLAALDIASTLECGECAGSIVSSHAWIEVRAGETTYLLDAQNQHYVRVTR